MTEPARDSIRRLALRYPAASAAEIARVVGVSRQRVSQILKKEHLTVGQPLIDRKGREQTRRRIPQPTATSRLITGGVPVRLNETAAGLVAELLVAADLTARGYVAFFPLTRTAACDLVSMSKTGKIERIEVRCGSRSGKTLVWNRKDSKRFDRYAVVITGEPVVYRPPLS